MRLEREDPRYAGVYDLFVPRFVDGYSYPEISAMRGESVDALRKRVDRLCERLRSEFE